jgi:Tfp pilus assembly protein PilF
VLPEVYQKSKRGIRAWAGGAAIAAAAWFVFSPALHGGWIWDDDVEITGNYALRGISGLREIWLGARGADYFPLKTTVQWLQWHAWHDWVAGYHATNLAFHLLGALLLWRVLRKLGAPLAWLGGLVFAVHPLTVESVAWVSELKNVLSLPFLLLAAGAWIDYDQAAVFWPQRGTRSTRNSTDSESPQDDPAHLHPADATAKAGLRFLLIALLCFLASLLCKTSGVMFPFVLLLYCWWKRGKIARRDFLAVLPFFAISLVLGLLTCWFQSHRAIAGEVVLAGGYGRRVVFAGFALAFYFWKSVFPVDLMPIYPAWSGGEHHIWQLWPWGLGAALLAGLWRLGRSGRSGVDSQIPWARHVLFGAGFFVLNLVPVLGFVPMSFLRLAPVADHLAYLPLVGMVGLFTAGAGVVWRAAQTLAAPPRNGDRSPSAPPPPGWRPPGTWALWLVPGVLVAVLALSAREYAGRFAGSESLWKYNLQLNPRAWAADNNLGNSLYDAGRIDDAVVRYVDALRLHPDYPEVLNNLGNILTGWGRFRDAFECYKKALQIKPNYSQALNGLGNLLTQTGHFADAEKCFTLALEVHPEFPDVHNNLGNLFFQLKRYGEAEAHLKEALHLRPHYAEALNNLGNVYIRTGRVAEADAEYREALRVNPSFPEAYNNLGNVAMMEGRLKDAENSFYEAIRIKSDYAEAYFNLGVLSEEGTGRLADALLQFRKALQCRPDFPKARARIEELERRMKAKGSAGP